MKINALGIYPDTSGGLGHSLIFNIKSFLAGTNSGVYSFLQYFIANGEFRVADKVL